MKFLSKIRTKSPEFRLMLSIGCAFVLTVVIVGGYVLIQSSGTSVKSSAPSPFSVVAGSIKDSIVTNSSQKTQVIDASATQTTHDESSPFGTSGQ
ncbi:MAG: hypothetical protein JWM20_562 [Patescibacteria group bacterium]|nr:hypothetical protein [Patescibacteria group bacterium]